MERELIAVSRSLISKTKNKGARKINLFKLAKEFCEQYIKVEDLDAFDSGFRDYLYNSVKSKSNGTLNAVGYQSLMKLYDIDDEKLKRIEIEYKKLSDIKLNSSYTEIAEFDAGIYAETKEELEKLKDFQMIDKFVQQIEKRGIKVNMHHLSRAFHPLTSISVSGLEPNINFIKSIRF